MTKYLILFGGLLCTWSCAKKEPSAITIVDIGHLDRAGIARELSIVNKYTPRVIGLDFLLTTDSLDKDIPLSEELSRTRGMIQATKLHNNDSIDITKWDSLEQYHPKFRFGNHGFSNMTITADSTIVTELPMRQHFRDDTEFSFSYSVAMQYDSYRINTKYKSGDDDFSFDKDSFEHNFKVISVKDLLDENFDKQDLTDKIVLMGAVSDRKESFYLDHRRSKRISGVVFQACIIKELLD